MEDVKDIDYYGWLTKDGDCETPYMECEDCEHYDTCFIRIVEQARGHQV